MAAFHDQFVQALTAGAGSYVSAEAANAGPLRTLEQDLPVPNVAVSANGFKLLQLGNATATAGRSDLAVVFGRSSAATATDGISNASFAIGANSPATATGGNLGFANDLGTMSLASTGSTGNFNFADAVGTSSVAQATGGDANIAIALGNALSATAMGGNMIDIVTIFGTL